MNKQKMTMIIICTVLAMILVAVGLVMWLLPGSGTSGENDLSNNTTQTTAFGDADTTDSTETDSADTNGDTVHTDESEENKETKPNEKQESPTIGIELEDETLSNSDSGDIVEIDFDDLLG